jgi:hypothetical protein
MTTFMESVFVVGSDGVEEAKQLMTQYLPYRGYQLNDERAFVTVLTTLLKCDGIDVTTTNERVVVRAEVRYHIHMSNHRSSSSQHISWLLCCLAHACVKPFRS